MSNPLLGRGLTARGAPRGRLRRTAGTLARWGARQERAFGKGCTSVLREAHGTDTLTVVTVAAVPDHEVRIEEQAVRAVRIARVKRARPIR